MEMSFENLVHEFGVGNGKTTACVNSLAYLIYAEQQGIPREDALANLTDMVDCICPVIRRLSIHINDRKAYWPDHDEATKWMHETAPRLLGTKACIEMTRRRAFLCADSAIREIAPVWFDLAADKWPEAAEWASKLRSCEPVVDTRSAMAAKKVAQEAKKAADAYAAAAKIIKPIMLSLLDRLIACNEASP